MKNIFFAGLILSYFSIIVPARAEEISLSFEEGKQRLLDQSLLVLAEYYQVDLAKTEVQAARTWNNPLFVWNADMYSHELNKYFNMGNQTLVQVEYVIGVSGERVQTIRQANLGVEIAELAFLDVVRGLVMEYSEAYNALYLLEERNKIYNIILERYNYLISLYNKRLELNVVSFNELVRIKSEFVSIQTEAYANENEVIAARQHLNSLLNFKSDTRITTQEPASEISDSLTAGSILSLAKTFRPDYNLAQKNISYYEQSIKVQKAQGGPSINLGYQPRDRGSNYVRPYAGLVFEMTLPIFDRNQAGIQAAKIELDQSKTTMQLFEIEMENEVVSAYLQFLNNQRNLESYTPQFMADIDSLSTGALENFQKQNISLLEFLDFQETYLTSEMQYLDIKANYLYSLNYLSFSIGKDITVSKN